MPAIFGVHEPPAADELGLAKTNCRGCLAKPLAECACCGRPALWCTLATNAHAISWCDRCYQVLLAERVDSPDMPLTAWPIHEPRKVAPRKPGRPHVEGQGVTKRRWSKKEPQPVLPWPDIGGDAA